MVADALSRMLWEGPPYQPGQEFDPAGFDSADYDQIAHLIINELPLVPKHINTPRLKMSAQRTHVLEMREIGNELETSETFIFIKWKRYRRTFMNIPLSAGVEGSTTEEIYHVICTFKMYCNTITSS